MEVTPAAMLTVLTLLVSSGCLRNLLVRLRLPLLVLTIGHRSSARSRCSLSVTNGLAARRCIRIDGSRGRYRWEILEDILLSCGRVCGDLSAETGVVALWGVALSGFKHGRKITIAVEEVRAILGSLPWG